MELFREAAQVPELAGFDFIRHQWINSDLPMRIVNASGIIYHFPEHSEFRRRMRKRYMQVQERGFEDLDILVSFFDTLQTMASVSTVDVRKAQALPLRLRRDMALFLAETEAVNELELALWNVGLPRVEEPDEVEEEP